MIDQNLCQSFNILDDLPGGAYICEIKDPLSDSRVIYANKEIFRMFECETMQEFLAHIDGRALNMAPAEDIPRIKKIIAGHLQKQEAFSHTLIRVITCLGRAHFVELSGRFVRKKDGTLLLYCLISDTERRPSGTPIDKEVREYVIHHIDDAIKNRWIQVYYQPVIRTLTGNLCGFEALSRWIDPQIGFLSPAAFIPALEQTQQIHKLDIFMLEEICRTAKERLSHDGSFVPVSFNLSRLDFATLDVFHTIETMVCRYGLPRDILHIEVTESTLARDPGVVQKTIGQLRSAGYEVWLDDFGSGYSSLNILKDTSLDLIKLDMGFLRSFTEKSRQIIASIIDMAKKLDIKTLTEGVETKEQADFLASIGCGRLQGYYFGKPQPLEGALAHNRAQGRQIEERKWHHYYDIASSVIHQTNRPIALLDFADDTARYLYANQPYKQQLAGMNYNLQTGEDSLNSTRENAIPDLFREFVQISRSSKKEEKYYYIDNGNYIRIYLKVILSLNNHTLVMTELKNITKDHEQLEHSKFDNNLRYIYMLFNHIHFIDLDHDTIEPLFMYEQQSAQTFLPQKKTGLKQLTHNFCQNYMHPEDRLRYEQFCNIDNIIERLAKSPEGRIDDCFRLRDAKGTYTWKRFTIMQVPNSQEHHLISTVSDIRLPAITLQNMLQETSGKRSLPAAKSLAALLWKNLQQNSRLCYFWKDEKRRFVGASKAFLDYYGFASEDAIIGKTDEDMGCGLACR